MELDQRGWTWALPNLLLGSLVIVPVWFLLYLFRPPARAAIDRPHRATRPEHVPFRWNRDMLWILWIYRIF